MFDTKMISPMVKLVATHERLVAMGTAFGNVPFIAICVIRPPLMFVKLCVAKHRFVAVGAAFCDVLFIAGSMVSPPLMLIKLGVAKYRLVAVSAALGNTVFITGDVAGLSVMRVETFAIDRLLTDSTAEMFGMPSGVEGSQVAATNGLGASFAD